MRGLLVVILSSVLVSCGSDPECEVPARNLVTHRQIGGTCGQMPLRPDLQTGVQPDPAGCGGSVEMPNACLRIRTVVCPDGFRMDWWLESKGARWTGEKTIRDVDGCEYVYEIELRAAD